MKNIYEIAEMEVVAFENEDVITTSGGLGDLVSPEDNFNGGAIH
jgi:hypothetical protein